MKIIGNHEANTIEQFENCVNKGAAAGVLCADGHLGYAQPVGGVLAYRGKVSISGVGFDIACGNMAVKLPIQAAEISDRLPDIAERIEKHVSFGVGRVNRTAVVAPCLEDDAAWGDEFVGTLKDLAAGQLGTVGSGNHYVDVFRDEEGWVWVGVHFGSRGLGHKTATYFLKAAGGQDGIMVDPCVVDLGSDLGERYLAAMALAGRYAYAGREWVCGKVAETILGDQHTRDWTDTVHNHHNFAWAEEHSGENLMVVRKGATPAFPGQRGFVGGSMGDVSVILRGTDTPAARENLYSTVHGAGRVMGRREAAGKTRWKGGKLVRMSTGKVNEEEMRTAVAGRGTILRGAGADEAPQVYRKLQTVLDYHADSIAIEHVLTPLIVIMAGSREHDPYKD